MTRIDRLRPACLVALFAGLAAPAALAQDSVADVPGGAGDAISPYGSLQVTRYVLDLVDFQSSWGSQFRIGPLLKASRDEDVLFNTNLLGSTALSPDLATSVTFPTENFSEWTIRGAGVTSANSAPGTVGVGGYDVQFGVALSDLNALATNAVGAIVGLDEADLSRLYVTRVGAAQSRLAAVTADTGTVSLGAVDADGNLHLRADGFNGSGGNQLQGENVVRVDLAARNPASRNGLLFTTSNIALDAPATDYVVDDGAITNNTPGALPASLGVLPTALSLDFANTYYADAGAPTNNHLDTGIDAHRGGPVFSAFNDLGGVGTVASIAKSLAGGGLADSINLFAIDSSGAVVATESATLPSPVPGGAITLNGAGDAEFLQYLSQTSFRGPNGLAAVGFDPITAGAFAAATATDPVEGDFVAVAYLAGGSPTWSVAAHVGSPVLDGPGGATIGQIGAGSPVSISAPAADSLGNVYFVGAYDPTIGADGVGLFKAVRTPTGYEIELVLAEGDAFTGANSASQYTIDRIMLGDSDSLASGAFNASSILQPQIPGHTTTDPAASTAFGGAIVNAKITYNNSGSAETYETVLFVGPADAPQIICIGDLDGDNKTLLSDFGIFAGNFGQMVPPGTGGDLNGDGEVLLDDFGIFAADFGCDGT